MFCGFLLAIGKSPLQFLQLVWLGGFGTAFSWSNTLQRASPMRRRYLAYGSNLCPEQMRQRCPAAEPGEMAALDGWRFIINRRGVATLLPCPGGRAWGLIW